MSEFLWFNQNIKVDNQPIFFNQLFEKGVKYFQNLNLLDHHLVKSNSLFKIEKLESRKVYCIINSLRTDKPTLQMYFEKKV